MNRALAFGWALGLGLFAGATAGMIVPSETLAEELRQTVGFTVFFVPPLYAVLVSRWTIWTQTNPYVRFAVYQLSFLASLAVFVRLSAVAFGASGRVADVAGFMAGGAALVVAAWMTFYGGADRIWATVLERTDFDW